MASLIERLEALVPKRTRTLDETRLIAREALPLLLDAVRTLEAEGCWESGTVTERCWSQPAADWPPEEWCRRCCALEPLLREAQP